MGSSKTTFRSKVATWTGGYLLSQPFRVEQYETRSFRPYSFVTPADEMGVSFLYIRWFHFWFCFKTHRASLKRPWLWRLPGMNVHLPNSSIPHQDLIGSLPVSWLHTSIQRTSAKVKLSFLGPRGPRPHCLRSLGPFFRVLGAES